MMKNSQNQFSRRDFVKTSAALSLATTGLIGAGAYAAGSDTLRVGLIGCGGRGRGAAGNILDAAPGVELYALGDLFQEPLDAAFRIPRPSGFDFYEFKAGSLGGRKGPAVTKPQWDTQFYGIANKYTFGEFTIDATLTDPEVTFRLIQDDSTVIDELRLKRSQLTPPGN